jgi:hypothetical protein
MVARHGLAAILRDARKSALLRMRANNKKAPPLEAALPLRFTAP